MRLLLQGTPAKKSPNAELSSNWLPHRTFRRNSSFLIMQPIMQEIEQWTSDVQHHVLQHFGSVSARRTENKLSNSSFGVDGAKATKVMHQQRPAIALPYIFDQVYRISSGTVCFDYNARHVLLLVYAKKTYEKLMHWENDARTNPVSFASRLRTCMWSIRRLRSRGFAGTVHRRITRPTSERDLACSCKPAP